MTLLLRDRAAADRARLVLCTTRRPGGTTSSRGPRSASSSSSPSPSSPARAASASPAPSSSPASRSSTPPAPTTASSATSPPRCTSFCSTTATSTRAGAWLRRRLRLPARPRRRRPVRREPWQRVGAILLLVAFVTPSPASTRWSTSSTLRSGLRRASPRASRLRAVSHRQHLSPVRPHHARAHRARIPDQRRRHHLGHARVAPQGGRSAAPSRLGRAASAARRLPALVLRPQLHTGAPEYVTKLLERLCRDPDAVQSLFRTPPSPHPQAARIVYWQYHFTTARRASRDRRLVDPRAARRHRRRSLRHALPRSRSARRGVTRLTKDSPRAAVSRRHEAYPAPLLASLPPSLRLRLRQHRRHRRLHRQHRHAAVRLGVPLLHRLRDQGARRPQVHTQDDCVPYRRARAARRALLEPARRASRAHAPRSRSVARRAWRR